MSKKIYEEYLGYTLLKPIVDYTTRFSYRKVEVKGAENIPTDGAVIIAPNHCNTLMDALVILRSFKGRKVFGARADMFNNKFIGKIMTFIRILPMVRQRDGFRNVLKNHETTDIVVETLEHKVPFCIYPEGRHRPAHSLLPLGKGVFRAALTANAKFGDKMPVYIVPTGIEYGDYFRYHSTSLVTYGKAINVTEFVKNHPVENEAQLFEPLKKELREGMSELITFIKDDENLGVKWELTKMLARTTKAASCALSDRMQRNKQIVSSIEKACESNPEATAELFEKVKSFEKARRKAGLSIYSFGKKNSWMSLAAKTLGAIAGLPYYLFSLIAALPLWVTNTILKKVIKDKAFRNTAAFGVKLGLGPFVFLMWTIPAFNLLAWPWALLISVGIIPAYGYFHDYNEYIRRYASDMRYLGHKDLKNRFKAIINEFNAILG